MKLGKISGRIGHIYPIRRRIGHIYPLRELKIGGEGKNQDKEYKKQ
jgi:hypothetical protein